MSADQLDLGDGVIEFQGVQYITLHCPEPCCPFTCVSAGHERVEHQPTTLNHVGGPVSNHRIVRTDQ